MTKYSDFVKNWAKNKGLSYGCASSMPELKKDYEHFKRTGEFDIIPIKRVQKKVEEEEFEITPVKKTKITKQSKERVGMGAEDINVGMPRSKINFKELLNKIEQIKELVGMAQQDRNVEMTNEIEITPVKKTKKTKITKQAKELVGMGAEDINVARPKARVNIDELISKLKNLKDRMRMKREDRNVAIPKEQITKEQKIKKYIEELNKIKNERNDASIREEAVIKKINATNNPSPILIKQATNLRKKYIFFNDEIERIVEELKKLR